MSLAAKVESKTDSSSGEIVAGSSERNSPVSPGFAYIGYFTALIWLFWDTLSELPKVWEIDPNYSHGFVVPVAFLIFFIRAWYLNGAPVSANVTTGDQFAGGIRIVLGGGLHVVSYLIDAPLFDVIAMILMATGAVILLAGRKKYRHYAFPMWFLVFMAPLPKTWYDTLAINMQQIASAFSAMIFASCGIPVYREGCYISIPNYQMEVGAACSGLRQLAAIVALSLAVSHLSQKTKFFKWSLGLLSIPIAIGANCIRVTLTGFILMWFGRKWAEGVYHTLEGLAIVAVAAVLILLTAWWLSTLKWSQISEKGADEDNSSEEKAVEKNRLNFTGFSRRGIVVITLFALFIGGQVFLSQHLSAVEISEPAPLKKPLIDLPMQLGEWRGEDREISERAAYGDQHVKRVYYHPGRNQSVSLWLIYSGKGLDREHHPEVCLTVAGQKENRKARQKIDVPGDSAPVQQYLFGTTNMSQWVFYWYYTLPSAEAVNLDKLQRFYQRMHQRPGSVTLQVYAPARSKRDLEGAREFVELVDKAIREHVGQQAKRGSRRTAVTVVQ
ncbi:MAG: hypothetical protein Tsb009_04510 [Planctomycetaceae bacterium]